MKNHTWVILFSNWSTLAKSWANFVLSNVKFEAVLSDLFTSELLKSSWSCICLSSSSVGTWPILVMLREIRSKIEVISVSKFSNFVSSRSLNHSFGWRCIGFKRSLLYCARNWKGIHPFVLHVSLSHGIFAFVLLDCLPDHALP